MFIENDQERDEEIKELERVAMLVATVDRIISGYERMHAPGRGEGTSTGPATLDPSGAQSEEAFRRQIDAAIEDERREARRADQDALTLFNRLVWIALGATVIGLMLAGAAVAFLIYRVRRPMAALMAGVGSLSVGRLDHRIGLRGNDEFALLGKAFDDMAVLLQIHHEQLTEARAALEATVEERTAALAEANRRLKETDALRQRFFADISHELRTPITVIRGEADVALRGRGKTAEVYQDALRRVVDQAKRLGRLVDDLLTVARANAGAVRLDLGAIPLPGLLKEACGDAAALAAGTVEFKLSPAIDDIVVCADRGRLMQLFMILLDNAARYCDPGAEVTVTATGDGERARVMILDRGAGMPPEDVANAFERFYRGDSGRRLAPEGSGLGLPLARAIVEAHRGDIHIDSEPGKGTTVTVTLPQAMRLGPTAA